MVLKTLDRGGILRSWITSHPSSWPSFSTRMSLHTNESVPDIIKTKPHSRSCTKSTLFRFRPDSSKRIRNYSHKKVDKPEIEHDDGDNEEKTRDEVFRVNHGIHQRRPL